VPRDNVGPIRGPAATSPSHCRSDPLNQREPGIRYWSRRRSRTISDVPAHETYRVEAADLQRDREAILGLWRRHLPSLLHPDRSLEWGYVDNPFAPGCIWKLIAGDRIVGAAGLLLKRIKAGNSVVLAGRLGGLAIESEHRSLGPALMLTRALLEARTRDGIAVVYTSSPDNLVPMMKRAGYVDVIALSRYVRVLDAAPYLRRHLPTLAARCLSVPANAALSATVAFEWRPGLVGRPDEFDGRFDDLWTRAAPFYGVTTERSSRFLKWRFRDDPVDIALTTVSVSSPVDDRLIGYGTYFMEGDLANIVDLFAENAQSALKTVLGCLVRCVRPRGATSIAVRCAGTTAFNKVLRSCGFRPRPDDHPLTLMVSPPLPGEQDSMLTSAAAWHFLAADDFWH